MCRAWACKRAVVWGAHRDGCSSLSCYACLHHLRALLGREGLRHMESAASRTKHAAHSQTACNTQPKRKACNTQPKTTACNTQANSMQHVVRSSAPLRTAEWSQAAAGWGVVSTMTGRACLHDRHYMVGGVIVRGAGEAALLEVGGQRPHRPCRAAANRPATCVPRKQQASVATLCTTLQRAADGFARIGVYARAPASIARCVTVGISWHARRTVVDHPALHEQEALVKGVKHLRRRLVDRAYDRASGERQPATAEPNLGAISAHDRIQRATCAAQHAHSSAHDVACARFRRRARPRRSAQSCAAHARRRNAQQTACDVQQ